MKVTFGLQNHDKELICDTSWRIHLLLRKVIQVSIWTPAPSRGVKSLGGDEVLEVPVGPGAPSGGVKFFGWRSRALCKVIEMAVWSATPPGRVKPFEDRLQISRLWKKRDSPLDKVIKISVRSKTPPVGVIPFLGGCFQLKTTQKILSQLLIFLPGPSCFSGKAEFSGIRLLK